MENYLYFAAADINTGGSTAAREGICVPASSYIGADPISATTTAFYFNGVEGTDRGVTKVLLTHGSAKNKATIKGVVRSPSWFANTFVFLPSITATHEFVVPKSIPIIFDMLCPSIWL